MINLSTNTIRRQPQRLRPQQHHKTVLKQKKQSRLLVNSVLSFPIMTKAALLLLCIIVILPSDAANQVYIANRRSLIPSTFLSRNYRQKFILEQQANNDMCLSKLSLIDKLRGGGSTADEDDDADHDEIEEGLDSANIEETASTTMTKVKGTSQLPPLSILIQTNVGSSLVDQVVELPMVNRQRTILSIKQSIHRQLPCKPPISNIQLIYQGQVIDDDNLLLLDVVDDDDDDEEDNDDDDGNNGSRSTDATKQIKMYIDMIPPVDPKTFIYDIESKINDVSTNELLRAYTTNEAAIYYNTQQILNYANQNNAPIANNDEDQRVLINAKIRERAIQIEKDLNATVLDTLHARKLLSNMETPKQKEIRLLASNAASAVEVRGERIRYIGINGIRGNYKRMIQRELNVEDWYTTTKHCLLFLFFGYFGGRTFLSRTILLLGAPVLFLCQTRFVKFYLRQMLFTLLYHPPAIILSLLPAPQQAILSLHVKDSIKSLYGDHVVIDETMRQSFLDDPNSSDSPSRILTSKRFTAAIPKKSDDNDVDDDEEGENDDNDDDDDDDDNSVEED